MAQIIEYTPTGGTLYTMPRMIFLAVQRARELRLARNVSGVLRLLPRELRNEVRATTLPPPPRPLRGWTGYIHVDELPFPSAPSASSVLK